MRELRQGCGVPVNRGVFMIDELWRAMKSLAKSPAFAVTVVATLNDARAEATVISRQREYKGAYWMRGGESLVPMTQDQLKRIFDEAQPDFSAQVCSGAVLGDLEPAAIAECRRRWALKSKRDDLLAVSDERVLQDAELIVDGSLTYAALILCGSHRALGRHLAQAEVVFEYRSHEASIAYQQRTEHRQGYFLFHDDLWRTLNLRNDLHSYQDGLFRYEIAAFNEDAVREAILNAVSHRDYPMAGSVFVRQFPEKIEVVSPGGFPAFITPDTILFKQLPRNRRIAEALARCGLVERSGQGADRMFGAAIREGKLPPSFDRTDAYQVAVTLSGKVQDERFLVFLEKLAKEQEAPLHTDDLLVLDAVHREIPIPEPCADRVANLVQRRWTISVPLASSPVSHLPPRRSSRRPAPRVQVRGRLRQGSTRGARRAHRADVQGRLRVVRRTRQAGFRAVHAGRSAAAAHTATRGVR